MNQTCARSRWMAILALFVMVLMPANGRAQSCYPLGMTGPVSITRDEFLQTLRTAYAFEAPEYQGGVVTAAERGDIVSVNGLLANDWPSKYITQLIFEKLVVASPVDGMPAPQLADYWEVSDDRRVYTFHINQAAKWHDGVDVTAHDVAFSYDAARSGFPNLRQFWLIRSQIASARAVDDDTFELVATDPTVTFLWDVPARISIVPRHIWEGVAKDQWSRDEGSVGTDPARVIGTGPFKFQERIPGKSIVLVRNDEHHSSIPPIEKFVLRVMDSHDIPGALIDGEVDIAEGVDRTNILAQVDDGSLVYGNPKLNRMRYLVFNTKVAPLNDVRVRRALFMALDREEINRVTTGAYGEVAIGTHPPLSIAYAPDDIAEQFEYDPVGAREALARAGWVDSNGDGIVDKDATQLRIELLTNAEMPQADVLLFALSEYWQEIGVEATYSRPARWDSVVEQIRRGGTDFNFDVMIRNQRWDPSGNQSDLFSGDPLGGNNLMGWSNADYDRLNKLQRHECDPVKRRELLIEMSNLVWNDVPVGVLNFIGASTAHSPLLRNFEFHDDTYWSLPFVWKEAASP